MAPKRSPSSLDAHRDTPPNDIPIAPRPGDNQACCRLLFLFNLGYPRGHLVEGVAPCKIGRCFSIDRSDLDKFIDGRLRERAS